MNPSPQSNPSTALRHAAFNHLRRWILVLVTPLFLAPGLLAAQEPLRALVEGGGAEWIVGEWTGTNSQGRRIAVEYEWALNGHALEVDLRVGEEAYEGMITRDPVDGAVVETGVDNGGGMTRATWRQEEGALISERTTTRPGGRTIAVVVISRQVDDNTFKGTVHGMTPDGTITADPTETVILKRLSRNGDGD